jgi:hypothetical protein
MPVESSKCPTTMLNINKEKGNVMSVKRRTSEQVRSNIVVDIIRRNSTNL